jgi:hypothetical protein
MEGSLASDPHRMPGLASAPTPPLEQTDSASLVLPRWVEHRSRVVVRDEAPYVQEGTVEVVVPLSRSDDLELCSLVPSAAFRDGLGAASPRFGLRLVETVGAHEHLIRW